MKIELAKLWKTSTGDLAQAARGLRKVVAAREDARGAKVSDADIERIKTALAAIDAELDRRIAS